MEKPDLSPLLFEEYDIGKNGFSRRLSRFHQRIRRKILSAYYGDWSPAIPVADNSTGAITTAGITTTSKYNSIIRDDILVIGMEDYLAEEDGRDEVMDDIMTTIPSHDDGSDILIIGVTDSRRQQIDYNTKKQFVLEKNRDQHQCSMSENSSDWDVDNITATLADMAQSLSLQPLTSYTTANDQSNDYIPKIKVIMPQSSIPSTRVAFHSSS
jgi:hypothetical protein